jgi:hypothetical protein
MTELIEEHGRALAHFAHRSALAMAVLALLVACGQKSETAPGAPAA